MGPERHGRGPFRRAKRQFTHAKSAFALTSVHLTSYSGDLATASCVFKKQQEPHVSPIGSRNGTYTLGSVKAAC